MKCSNTMKNKEHTLRWVAFNKPNTVKWNYTFHKMSHNNAPRAFVCDFGYKTFMHSIFSALKKNTKNMKKITHWPCEKIHFREYSRKLQLGNTVQLWFELVIWWNVCKSNIQSLNTWIEDEVFVLTVIVSIISVKIKSTAIVKMNVAGATKIKMKLLYFSGRNS